MSHVHIEGNACNNWLANHGYNLDFFTNFNYINLPSSLKGLIRLDKIG